MRCGKAREGRRDAPQLSLDEQGQIAIKLGGLLVAKEAAGRRHKKSTNWAGEHHAG
jgi:hypothetical protein